MSERGATPRRVLLVGPWPPPWGGDAVQVLTLRRRLDARPDVDCRVLDFGTSRAAGDHACTIPRGRAAFVARLFAGAARADVVHLFTNGHNDKSWVIALLAGLAGRLARTPTVVSLGSGLGPAYLRRAGPVMRRVVRAAVRLARAVLCSNDEARDALIAIGAPHTRLRVSPGFRGVDVTGAPPPAVTEFRRHAPLLGAMASTGAEYGIPLLLDAAAKLRDGFPHLGLLLIGPARVRDPRLGAAVLCAGELAHPEALAAMATLDVFVRPTTFDGDALSVREALALGVPVVASATGHRPPGVSLFAAGDCDDLLRALAAACAAAGRPRTPIVSDGDDALRELLTLYRAGR